MNQFCIMLESERNCQVRLGAPFSPGNSRSYASNADLVLSIQYAHQAAPSRRGSLWQVSDIPPRSKPCSWSSIFCTIPSSGGGARVQSDDHHVQANLPAAKTTTHTMRNRNIETAKLACFLNSLRPSFIRVVRRKNIERTKRKIGIAAARKAMILKIIVHSVPCNSLIRSTRRRGRAASAGRLARAP